jgi:hypothetical protein
MITEEVIGEVCSPQHALEVCVYVCMCTGCSGVLKWVGISAGSPKRCDSLNQPCTDMRIHDLSQLLCSVAPSHSPSVLHRLSYVHAHENSYANKPVDSAALPYVHTCTMRNIIFDVEGTVFLDNIFCKPAS